MSLNIPDVIRQLAPHNSNGSCNTESHKFHQHFWTVLSNYDFVSRIFLLK